MFAAKEFAAAGSTLLKVFPARPKGVNHTDVYKRLDKINRVRNRIAHHQPICFDKYGALSVQEAEIAYQHVLEILTWLGYDASELLKGIDDVASEFKSLQLI
ncbi:MAG: hypothetical protein EOO39_34195 [Cytophagaceae bacterium]|nr:MAG: hypothetical protein EOO39_34195 [Cytophagaceae bacterium]